MWPQRVRATGDIVGEFLEVLVKYIQIEQQNGRVELIARTGLADEVGIGQ